MKELDAIPGRGLYTEEARKNRLQFITDKLNLNLDSLGSSLLPSDSLKGNIENHIGDLTIPIGLAGPLLFQDKFGNLKERFAPIATTEGALVASLNRGCRALTLSGGVRSQLISKKMNRVPMFEFNTIYEAIFFSDWVQLHFSQIQSEIKKFSRFSELTSLEPKHLGRSVHLKFIFKTGDAAGQNMTTICTWNVCKWVISEFEKTQSKKIKNFVLDGNLSADKKAASVSVLNGRGCEIIAEAEISEDILKSVLKIGVDELVHLTQLVKSARIHSGVFGWNINVANVIAGIFAATGQDIASVHESSIAEFHLEKQTNSKGEKSLYISLYLPCLIVGSVGGGTKLPVQSEMLKILSSNGSNEVENIAESIAAFCLALDISTLCALAGGQFADAHERLGRSEKTQFLKYEEINENFILNALTEFQSHNLKYLGSSSKVELTDSLVMDMSSQINHKYCGFSKHRIEVDESPKEVLLKIKPLDHDVILASEKMASFCSPDLKKAYQKVKHLSLFRKNHIKEIEINKLAEVQELGIAPKFYGSMIDEQRQIFLLAQEFIDNFEFAPHAENSMQWNFTLAKIAIAEISKLHSVYLNRSAEFSAYPWMEFGSFEATLNTLSDFFHELIDFGSVDCKAWLTSEMYEHHQKILHDIPVWSKQMDLFPKTLIHNDFNPRNVGFCQEISGERRFVAFDWELATISLPQRDVIELLCFISNESWNEAEVLDLIEFHRIQIETLSGRAMNESEWLQGALYSLREFIVHRLSLYFVANSFIDCNFLARVYKNSIYLERLLNSKLQSD